MSTTFLGNEEEEKIRKDELRSIVRATFVGLLLGGLVGGLLNGYRGFVFGLLIGPSLMSIFAVLGVKAERRQRERERKRREPPSSATRSTSTPAIRPPVRQRRT